MDERFKGKGGPRIGAARPAAVRLSPAALVAAAPLAEAGAPPLAVRPLAEGLNLAQWAARHRPQVESWLLEHGAILFRGFGVSSASEFESFARAVSDELLEYQERAAPRSQVSGHVYTSTEFPADQRISLHHEMSYSHNWPRKVLFYCEQPAAQGGSTPLSDDREVFRLLDPKIKERFMSRKVMYVRNYGTGVDLSWEDAFQTTDRAVVEEYCRKSRTAFEWREGNRLRTRYVRQAVATHPVTGETVWFNHAHMFHVSSLPPEVQRSLLEVFTEDELPRNVFYGDGAPIERSCLEEIRETYRRAALSFPWEKGDVLLVDNFLASHGREPYVGPRKVLVALADLYTNEQV
ncbi:MAG TPA: TauD/TfdA family dioxygenase [Pyrinomonadaceae bacterium]|jgi:alpha-ketoglutarate-dependent taurine dioxygenase